MWSLNDLLMMLEDADGLDRKEVQATFNEASRHLILMDKELQDLRPIGKAIKRLAIQATGHSNGQ